MSRTALVTGANRGIGLEFARQWLARGERVIATCRRPGKATELNALAGEHPGRLRVLPLDVTDPDARAELVAELPLVLDEDVHIDLLINNAGVLHAGERFGQLRQTTLEDSLHVNAIAPLLVTQVLATRLADGAKVVNISSQLGSLTSVTRFGAPSYAISKAAQNMVTVQLAQALAARGIVVLALHPGWVQTAMGGPQATDAPADAVAGMLRVIEAATLAQSGGFFDWRGERLPW